MIDRLRTFIGYREYPKYAIVSRHAVYKQALLEEADRLVRARVLRDREDIFYLSLEEFRDVVRTGRIDEECALLPNCPGSANVSVDSLLWGYPGQRARRHPAWSTNGILINGGAATI
jgi:hypothetical protein